MPTPDSTSPRDQDEVRRKAAEALRLARIFGDVLPDTTGDERGEQSRRSDNDEWLRSQVPPHHG
ncbi:hypothetical protein ACFXK0_10780 [Nocardia sp. NPDC059177]|uniref:hypothetical protein n=1 Tax=Nocardia sp. NPDC059177 TaxID=3346759 RepID=UPI0036C1F3CF